MTATFPDMLEAFPTERPVPMRTQWRSANASQQIHDALRARILSLELKPGENLSRDEIAESYGVSRTPVRDAMMKLEEEGLLTIFPQSKTEVSRIDVAQVRETQFLRMSLEIEITKRLAKAKDARKIAPARSLLQQQRDAFEAQDLTRFSSLDRAFHSALFEAVNIANIWTLITERSGHLDRLRKLNLPDPGKAAQILHYHSAILDAIEAGDPELTEEMVRHHLSGTLSQVEEIMARHPDYF